MDQRMRFLLGQANLKRLETQIAIQCAPVILGIKISNMLIVDSIYKNAVRCIFHDTELYCYMLGRNNSQAVFLIYYKQPLRKYLQEESVWELMQQLGYCKKSLQPILEEFAHRYDVFLRTRRKFPHELGLLLGYPPHDVLGFIQNKGKNYLYSGYWKVYRELENTKRTFARYDKAKMLLMSWVLCDGAIREVLTFRKDKDKEYGNYRKRVIDKM